MKARLIRKVSVTFDTMKPGKNKYHDLYPDNPIEGELKEDGFFYFQMGELGIARLPANLFNFEHHEQGQNEGA